MDWITFLLGLLFSIPIGIFVNFATPWVKSAYERSVFVSKKKRIQRLLDDYQNIKIYKENPLRFIVKLLSDIIVLMFLINALVLVTGLIFIRLRDNTTPTIVGELYFGFFILMFIGIFAMVNWRLIYIKNKSSDIFDFDEYEKEVIEQLGKLGATTEDII